MRIWCGTRLAVGAFLISVLLLSIAVRCELLSANVGSMVSAVMFLAGGTATGFLIGQRRSGRNRTRFGSMEIFQTGLGQLEHRRANRAGRGAPQRDGYLPRRSGGASHFTALPSRAGSRTAAMSPWCRSRCAADELTEPGPSGAPKPPATQPAINSQANAPYVTGTQPACGPLKRGTAARYRRHMIGACRGESLRQLLPPREPMAARWICRTGGSLRFRSRYGT